MHRRPGGVVDKLAGSATIQPVHSCSEKHQVSFSYNPSPGRLKDPAIRTYVERPPVVSSSPSELVTKVFYSNFSNSWIRFYYPSLKGCPTVQPDAPVTWANSKRRSRASPRVSEGGCWVTVSKSATRQEHRAITSCDA